MAVPEAIDRAELSFSATARLLASDMREELLAIIREIFNRNAYAERLGISKEPVHDLLRTGQLGPVKAERRKLISSGGWSCEGRGRAWTWPAPTVRLPRGSAGSRTWSSVQRACPRSDHRETSATSTATRPTEASGETRDQVREP
jgi:hypothetical protein